jgi:hypothetical protein
MGTQIAARQNDDPRGTARRDPETGSIAVRMGPGVTIGEWFVVHPDNGGHYTDDRTGVITAWPELRTQS